ncbi:unnamed protein product [Porites evermanni]|uniref:Ribosomal protein S4 n=1 Tax=Porites evermanni TaxID=104178 RepID=A0ABN8M1P6_9CNID|nr:unnamed protein product [Porites evermanni]
MPERSTKVYVIDRPWLSVQLKQLIARRQKAFASGNHYLFKILRNKVNRERKRCRKVYYENKVEGLRASRPRDWWREVKQLCGSTKSTERDLKSMLHKDLVCEDAVLAEKINQASTHFFLVCFVLFLSFPASPSRKVAFRITSCDLLYKFVRAYMCMRIVVVSPSGFTCMLVQKIKEKKIVFHSSLPYYLSEELERIQKRALRIIFPYAGYNSALKEAGIPSLYDRRVSLSSDLFNDIVLDINHKLAGLLPPKAEHHRQLRSNRKFNVPVCKTDRLKKSFIVSHSLRM